MRSRRWLPPAPMSNLLGERGKYPPRGVNGGGPAAFNRFYFQTADGEASPPMVSKITGVHIEQGWRVRIESPGGGGWGDPMARDPERVARDVRLGYVSREMARTQYGVVIGEDGALDQAATLGARGDVPAA